MIRVLIFKPAPTGFFPYRIDGHWGPDGAPLIGIAEDPIGEAKRVLAALGVAPGTLIGVVDQGRVMARTTVGSIPPPPKALPPPRRRPRKRSPVVRGSGVPGDG